MTAASITATVAFAVLAPAGQSQAVSSGGPLLVGAPWSIVGTGASNIAWYNSQTGETQLWYMNQNEVTAAVDVVDEQGRTAYVGPPWSVAAVADMNGDGQNDIIWHNSETNETQIWMMNGQQITNITTTTTPSGFTPAPLSRPKRSDFRFF